MPLNKQQADKVKKQLLKQLEFFPEDKRDQIKEQILSMNEKQLEQFIQQNQLAQGQTPQQCIFCSILEGKIPSYQIDENKNNIAILEINPLSKGHALVIPKTHTPPEKIPSNAFSLAKKIAKKLKSKFKPKEVKIQSSEIFGHGIVEVLPLYGSEKERKKAPESELQKLQKQLKVKSRKKSTPRKKKTSSLPQIKPRIP